MNKTVKRILVTVLVIAAVIGVIWGVMAALRTARRQPVNVYSVSSFSSEDSWGNSSQSSGMVTVENLQKIYLSSTQTVTDVYVEEGQAVKKGDRLLAYDTTLTNLDVEYASIALERQRLNLNDIRQSVEELGNLYYKKYWEYAKLDVDARLAAAEKAARLRFHAGEAPPLPSVANITDQTGTEMSPIFIQDTVFTLDSLKVLATNTDVPDLNKDLHVVVYHHDDQEGDVTTQGFRLHESSGDWVISLFPAPEIPVAGDAADSDPEVQRLRRESESLEEMINNPMVPESPEDALKQRAELERQLKDAQISLKLAELDFEKKQREVADSAVYSTQDGIVKAVRSADEAYQASEPVIEVSGGGGYYVTGAVSELELNNVRIGDTVQIQSWMTGASCEGSIVSVDNYPTSQSGWGGGNQNVSYYPFKAFVSEDANLRENDYVNISYQSSGTTSAWYLDNMFIRVENGKSYVYVRGEDGLLEQRSVLTGRDLWGSYTEIRGGLTKEDYVAFPYGKDVVPGAKTNESTPNELYGG